ncbi:DnaJ domain-containing protein [Bacteroides sp.]|jgi:hypothetical protein|uniref:J domain-containing protein n=1 Tax=Bacteroides sp. TaxID=29523 RepID=UPI0025831A86|nr:DnaJ domain-containing protein [Bacteroides sp.]
MKNYYQILGLKEGVTLEEVQCAYKEYTEKFNPQRYGNDKFFITKYEEIEEAYTRIINEDFSNEDEIEEDEEIETDAFVKLVEQELIQKGYFHLEQLHQKIDDYGSKILNLFLVLYGTGLVCYLAYLIYDYPRSFNYFLDNIMTEVDYFISETKTPLGFGILIWFVLGIGMVIALWLNSMKGKAILEEVYKDYNIQISQNTNCENTNNKKKQGTSKHGCFLDTIIIILDLVIALAVIVALEWFLFTYCSFNTYIMITLALIIFGIIVIINARVIKHYFPNIGKVRNPNYNE